MIAGTFVLSVMLAFAVVPASVLAHGDARHGGHSGPKVLSTEEKAFGREGDPGKATRIVRIRMADTMRFDPPALAIRRGETVRFVVRNDGKVLHEMVIGTIAELKEHAALMRRHPGMEHDEPYMAHVDPGKTQDIVWQFTKAGEFHFGCLIPGHFEAGMIGRIVVK